MLEKKFNNEDLGIELTSYIDNKQNVWFLGKDVAEILGNSNVRKAIWIHVDSEDKKQIFTHHTSYPKWVRWLQVVVCVLILMNPVSTPFYYPQNWNLRKSSNIG